MAMTQSADSRSADNSRGLLYMYLTDRGGCVQLGNSKNARRFTEYLDKQLEALLPFGSPPELKHACDVWVPKRTIKAWSERRVALRDSVVLQHALC